MSPRRQAQRAATALESLLDALPPLTLVVGKGGVGKTTCAVGIAARSSEDGRKTLVLSTDPAGTLAGVLNVSLGDGEAHDVPAYRALAARQLDARRARHAFLERWRETIVTIVDRGTYLDLEDIEGLVDATFPGADEIFALLALADLVAASSDQRATVPAAVEHRFIVDTAPTGHTLRLLALPETFEAMVSLLDAMQAKHRFMVGALTRRYRADDADRFLEQMRATISALRATLADPARAAAVLVTRAEPVVVAETGRYAAALRAIGLRIAALIVNALPAARDEATTSALAELATIAPHVPHLAVPQVSPAPRTMADIEQVIGLLEPLQLRGDRKRESRGVGKRRVARDGLRSKRGSGVSSVSGGAPRAQETTADLRTFLRTLTITGGKGGVGKTTVSLALAIAAASSERPVLIVSTDPAPSIGDALGVNDRTWARTGASPVQGVAGLFAWQMDATQAFTAFRDRYRGRIDALFDAFVGRGLDVAHDRAILRELLALAPPGVDELYALASLGETLDEGRYTCIVVDPAPTGHLLRLLEMPALALEWSHRLMRLMLKYKDVAGLGDAAEELLGFSKRTRAVEALFRDPERAGVVLVTLDEPIVRAESLRLAAALRSTGVSVIGVVENRAQQKPESGDQLLAEPLPHVAAPVHREPLVGADAIRGWSGEWQLVGRAAPTS